MSKLSKILIIVSLLVALVGFGFGVYYFLEKSKEKKINFASGYKLGEYHKDLIEMGDIKIGKDFIKGIQDKRIKKEMKHEEEAKEFQQRAEKAQKDGKKIDFTDEEKKIIDYISGYSVIANIINRSKVSKEIKNIEAYLDGYVDAIQGIKSKVDLKILDKKKKEKDKLAEKYKKKQMDFLENNSKEKDVMTTESGLQYKILKEGDSGVKPKPDSSVKVHYKGTLIDGTEFDSSYSRGEPISFALNGVIKGWQEGLLLMKEGSKFLFFIPSDLAYGSTGQGKIPAYSTLIFEVELIKVKVLNK